MSRWLRGVVFAAMLTTWWGAGLTDARERATVTVRQLFDLGHRTEVSAGGEGVRAGPRLDRVWFPTGAENPKVERVPGGIRAVFGNAGTYRGSFRVAGGHGTNDVYNMPVAVKPPSQ